MPTPGPLELVIILVIALLVLGPGKLPDVGAALGKSIREFRKASSDVQEAVKRRRRHVAAAATPPAAATPAVPIAGAAGRRAARSRSRRRPGRSDRPDPDRIRAARRTPPTRRPPPASRAPSTRPWPTLTPCASRVSAASRDARPGTAAAADRRARRRVGHVPHRPPRGAAHPPVPGDPGGRRLLGRRVLRVGRRSSSCWRTPSPATARCTSPAWVTRSSSRSRSRSSSGSSWRCRSCSTRAGRSSRRA